jgi:hypothetical protein
MDVDSDFVCLSDAFQNPEDDLRIAVRRQGSPITENNGRRGSETPFDECN